MTLLTSNLNARNIYLGLISRCFMISDFGMLWVLGLNVECFFCGTSLSSLFDRLSSNGGLYAQEYLYIIFYRFWLSWSQTFCTIDWERLRRITKCCICMSNQGFIWTHFKGKIMQGLNINSHFFCHSISYFCAKYKTH